MVSNDNDDLSAPLLLPPIPTPQLPPDLDRNVTIITLCRSFTHYRRDLSTGGQPDITVHVAGDPYFGQLSLRRTGHRVINMEWPENYEYQSTLKLRAGTRKLGHTVTPQYAPYTIRSSDVLSSDHLYGMQTTANTKAKKGVKGGSAMSFTGTTPFAQSVGVSVASLPGYQSLSRRSKRGKASALPPIRRDTTGFESCNGRNNRLLSVLTNSTPVFVDN